jgi:hypothetical protein
MSEQRYAARHLGALRRFAVTLTILNVLGYTILGFEGSYAQPLLALATAYTLQIALELLEAWSKQRAPRFLGGFVPLVDFLLSPHITALATAMLLYFNDQLWPVAFAVAVAVGSKAIFRAPVGQGSRHIFNPSNFGITMTLVLLPSTVGMMLPWQFTQNLSGTLNWGLISVLVVLGSYLNTVFTRRIVLVTAFVVGFAVQAVVRALLFENNLSSSLGPLLGLPLLLFTFYMAPDPATTPDRPWRQVAFGLGIAAVYGVLVALHVAFALFYALTLVCAVRGIGLYVLALVANNRAVVEADRKRLVSA